LPQRGTKGSKKNQKSTVAKINCEKSTVAGTSGVVRSRSGKFGSISRPYGYFSGLFFGCNGLETLLWPMVVAGDDAYGQKSGLKNGCKALK
jgi:hypothetical protein